MTTIEQLTTENTQLKKDYTRIKESATLWHDRYKTKCQEYIDRQSILGAEIVALEAERDDWKLRTEFSFAERNSLQDTVESLQSALKLQLADMGRQAEKPRVERDALAKDAERVRVYKQRCLAAEAERDALRADAMRYQFIRDGNAYIEPNHYDEDSKVMKEMYMALETGKYYADMRDFDMDIDAGISAIAGEKT